MNTLLTTVMLFLGTVACQTNLGKRAVSNTSKAGLAWPNADRVDIRQYESTGKVSWYYSWSPWPITSPTNLEFVPMLWGSRSIDQFTSTINSSLSNLHPKVAAVLGMNEPEQTGQSNLTPQQGAQMWIEHIEPLRSSGVRLGSPAPSSAPAGKAWLQSFFTACNGRCNVDFIALHWYGVDADAFIAYLTDNHDTFRKPIWVTEWACQNYVDLNKQCSAEDVIKFMNRTQSFMDNASFVERYAWFGAMRDMQGVNPYNALMDKGGRISNLGMQYIGSSSTVSWGVSTMTRSRIPSSILPLVFTAAIPLLLYNSIFCLT